MERIIYYVEAGSEIGLGHLLRAVALAQDLRKHYQVHFIINNSCFAASYLRRHDFKFNILKKGLSSKQSQPDAIIFDAPNPPVEKFKTLKTDGVKFIALDYFNYSQPLFDVVINIYNHSNTPLPRGIRYFEGLKYVILREELVHTQRLDKKKTYIQPVKTIFASFGGSDIKNFSYKIINMLEKNVLEKLMVNLLLGGLNKKEKMIKEKIKHGTRHNYNIYINIENVRDLMESADLAFSNGGTTLLELLYLGVPTIVFAQNEREYKFAAFIQNKGACQAVENLSSKSKKSVLEAVEDCTIRERIGSTGMSLIDGKGKERIIKIIRNLS